MLVGAAKRLTTGSATGIDIWQAEDLSGNRPEATLENARREGVADRIEIQTADMREIPFPDATFDAVVSCSAIHNLYAAPDRAKAIREIARVLKPGGQAVIDDIRHGREYAAQLRRRRLREGRERRLPRGRVVPGPPHLGIAAPGDASRHAIEPTSTNPETLRRIRVVGRRSRRTPW